MKTQKTTRQLYLLKKVSLLARLVMLLFKLSLESYSQARSSISPRFCEWIYYLQVESLSMCIFQIYLCISAFISSKVTCKVAVKFLPAQVSWVWSKYLQSNFIHSKIFWSDRIFGSGSQNSDADLNLIPMAAMANVFICQIIDFLMESMYAWPGVTINRD